MLKVETFLIFLGFISSKAWAVYHKPAPLPGNLNVKYTDCPLIDRDIERPLVLNSRNITYLEESQIAFQSQSWPKSLPDMKTLNNYLDSKHIYATVVDVQKVGGELKFAYLSNGTHNQTFQPWSSSKFLASLSAIRMMRKKGIGANYNVFRQ